MPRLFHVSDKANIEVFNPKFAPQKVVWAIDEVHLPNYLLPRDCPRVCFRNSDKLVIAIEWRWLERIRSSKMFLYEFEDKGFVLNDSIAGYYTSLEVVVPCSVKVVEDLLYSLQEKNVELRIQENLWSLHDQVVASTPEFSMIRMRNASPRDL